MSMKEDDLIKLKIEILAEDETNFMEIATLVDGPEFLSLLPLLRKEYGINEEEVNLDNYDKNLDLIANNNKSHIINFSKYKNSKQLLEYTKEHIYLFNEKVGMETYPAFDTEMLLMCYLFRRPPIFSSVCFDAVLCGTVGDCSYRTTKVVVNDSNNLFTSVSDLALPHISILVSPNSSDREITEAGRIAKTLYKTDKRLNYYKPRTDLVNKIKVYREWYWLHMDGKKYTEIADLWANKDDVDFSDLDDNRVGKSIRFYKKLLTQ